jgi:hypothetical protein
LLLLGTACENSVDFVIAKQLDNFHTARSTSPPNRQRAADLKMPRAALGVAAGALSEEGTAHSALISFWSRRLLAIRPLNAKRCLRDLG